MAAETEKELLQLKKRFSELADKSYQQNIYTFSGFLSLAEQEALFEVMDSRHFRAFRLWGGHENCERQMVRFGSPEEFGYEEEFPVTAVHIKPLMEKFADNLTHRDFLGAVMNLGIERSTVGDIFIEGKQAWIFCLEKIAPYICESLDKVRHTSVKCQIAEGETAFTVKEPEPMGLIVSGIRVDAVLAKVYNLSRNQSLDLFRAGKVYINGRLCENNSCSLKENDKVSARGFGRFVFLGTGSETRKGRLNITVGVYK